jgi:septum formation protein
VREPLPKLVLASASPRRRELLSGLGLSFEVRPVDLDETPRAGEAPREYVLRLALGKAAARASTGELVLAADTIVVIDGELLGKPRDPGDARRMLRRIAGREHTVLSGVALLEAPCEGQPSELGEVVARSAATVETSRVVMAPLGDADIAWYVATGEPLDKAGSYAVQGLGALFVETVHGNYTNVVGLPLPATHRLFRELGHDLLSFRAGGAPTARLSPRT